MTYMLILNCALKLVEEIILYYDARSKKHKKKSTVYLCSSFTAIIRISKYTVIFPLNSDPKGLLKEMDCVSCGVGTESSPNYSQAISLQNI